MSWKFLHSCIINNKIIFHFDIGHSKFRQLSREISNNQRGFNPYKHRRRLSSSSIFQKRRNFFLFLPVGPGPPSFRFSTHRHDPNDQKWNDDEHEMKIKIYLSGSKNKKWKMGKIFLWKWIKLKISFTVVGRRRRWLKWN